MRITKHDLYKVITTITLWCILPWSIFAQDFNSLSEFEDSACYTSEAATLSSVLYSFSHTEDSQKVEIKNSLSGNSIFFRIYSPQKESKKWLLIFAGIGTGVDDIHAIKAAALLRKSGYTNGMIIIPSVFREDFAQSFSRSGVVGNIPVDVSDLLQAMEQLRTSFLDQKFQITSFDYFGFSLGALSAAHLSAQLESSDNYFKPGKVILMNSPINLLKSLQNIDRLSLDGANLIQSTQVAVSYLNFLKKYPSKESIHSLLCELQKVDQGALSGVITESLKFNLDELFLYGQSRYPTDALDQVNRRYIRSSRERRRMRRLRNLRIANQASFESYVRDTVLPSSSEENLQVLNNKVSITSLSPLIKNNPKYFVIHTEDDFLQSSRTELNQYTSLFLPQNKWVVPRGGHLGLLNSLALGETLIHFLN